jgi:hypothetical protein
MTSTGPMPELADNYYRSAGARDRHERRRRWDRRAQIAAVLLAIAAGVVAGMLGTHRAWEHPAPAPTTVTRPAG